MNDRTEGRKNVEVIVREFRPHQAGAKIGFADVEVPGLGILIRDVGIFEGHRGRWARLPARRIPDGDGVKFVPHVELLDSSQGADLEESIAAAVGPVLEATW